jgi:hypothetical protein
MQGPNSPEDKYIENVLYTKGVPWYAWASRKRKYDNPAEDALPISDTEDNKGRDDLEPDINPAG